jgi:hypothetical protein
MRVTGKEGRSTGMGKSGSVTAGRRYWRIQNIGKDAATQFPHL